MEWYWIVLLTILGCSIFGALLYTITKENEEIQLLYSVGIIAPFILLINAIYRYCKNSKYRAKQKNLKKRL